MGEESTKSMKSHTQKKEAGITVWNLNFEQVKSGFWSIWFQLCLREIFEVNPF